MEVSGMGFPGIIAVLALAAGAIFALLNPSLLFEPRTVELPGGAYGVPLVGVLLGAAAAAIVLMLLGDAVAAAAWRASHARLRRRIDERERELVDIKAEGIVDVYREIEALRRDLAARIDALGQIIDARVPATTVHSTLRDTPDHDLVHRETTVTRRGV
jgi:hypothetical protein